MSYDHITMLQIDAGKARIYAVRYQNSDKLHHFKSEGYISGVNFKTDSDDAVYGLVRGGKDGKLAVVEIIGDVTDTFMPQDDITYNWIIKTFESYYLRAQARRVDADQEARRRLERAQAMSNVRNLQKEMGVDVLTGNTAVGLPPADTYQSEVTHVSTDAQDDGYSEDEVTTKPSFDVADDTQF